jgi:hypothetical protein
MAIRILLYGGTHLGPDSQQLVAFLTRELLLNYPDVTLVSGGFFHHEAHEDWYSVDRCVLEAAENALPDSEFMNRFETWLPTPTLDRKGVRRFRKGKVHVLEGSSSQARRYRLAQLADGIVTIGGQENTLSLLELAIALEKPALPIAFTGGDSLDVWKQNREDLLRILRLEPEAAEVFDRQPASEDELENIAKAAARCIYAAAERRCLVLMPFDSSNDLFYTDHLRPAIERAEFISHRIDKNDYAGDIPALFQQAILKCSAIVVDITGMNPNVLYELGQLHAKGLQPLLVLRQQVRPDQEEKPDLQLPFYLLHQMVIKATDDENGRKAIAAQVEAYLRSKLRRQAKS